MSLLIQNAKLIFKTYEKLYWSIDENSSKVLKRNGCNIKIVSNDKYGISYNISTKVLSDTLCVMYKSLTKDMLEEHCSYDIVVQIKTYDYMGKSGKSMTSYIKKKTADKTITINKDILRLMTPAGVALTTDDDVDEEEEEVELLLED
jgi:hypothetical protein